jgi:hypothetical protein
MENNSVLEFESTVTPMFRDGEDQELSTIGIQYTAKTQ